jgi:hypothetical protein
MRQSDPQAVGEWLLRHRNEYGDTVVSLHFIANHIPWDEIPEIDKKASLVQETVANYVEELKNKTTKGDKWAGLSLAYYEEHGTFEGIPQEPTDL